MTWHRISASCWGGSTVGATCCLMPRCKRDRFRHLSDAMSLKQSKDCICPVCPVFAIILLSFFPVLQNPWGRFDIHMLPDVRVTNSVTELYGFVSHFLCVPFTSGWSMSPGERQPASHQNMSISIWDLGRCEEDWWICQLLSSKKYLKLKPSVWMTSMIHWMLVVATHVQGQDMSIPGDAPQNLLRPEAAEVTDELFANGWRGGSLDKAVPQINMP